MYILIDNYDSFTYNLLHFLGELGAEVEVYRNDKITPEKVLALSPDGIVLSPGPCDPNRAGICVELVRKAVTKVPILGVCLGHQSIGQAFGANIKRAVTPMHGKLSNICHNGLDIFQGIVSPFAATRYHSLIVQSDGLPACLEITARTEDDIIMGLRHKERPIFGVQFHPESIASENGHALLANFLRIAHR
ncbi:MAG: Anthranilate synthase component 2 [Alphaproteobacteria bacterium MarineAlpha9_Bin7]|nr:MAG: Anthranilate synthase component 2 [Alphaproteobacteria bacterium MarineAlpha9_Bin7]